MNELGLTRAAATALRTAMFRPRGWKTYTWQVEVDGRSLVIKDVRNCHPLFRFTIGRWLIRREAGIYRRLAGLDFVPQCFGRLDRDALVLEYLPAPSLTHCPEHRLAPEFFPRLAAQIGELHGRGIVHLDLRHRSNILVAADGSPRLIDFQSSIDLRRHAWIRWLFARQLIQVDLAGLLKWRMRYAPHAVGPAEHAWYARFRAWRGFWLVGRSGQQSSAAAASLRKRRSG